MRAITLAIAPKWSAHQHPRHLGLLLLLIHNTMEELSPLMPPVDSSTGSGKASDHRNVESHTHAEKLN